MQSKKDKPEDKIIDKYQLTETLYIVELVSGNSGKHYNMHLDWRNGKWKAITCSCGGNTNTGFCRHLASAEKIFTEMGIKGSKKEKKREPLVKKYWYECEICGSKTFYIKPPIVNRDGKIICQITTAVCTVCGRLYELE